MNISIPTRATRSYTQRLCAKPATVFPLLCPVREGEWLARWEALAVKSRSGVAEVDCVFTTPDSPHNAVWYITRYEPEAYFIEMIKLVPDVTACRLTIQLREVPEGSEATVTYMHTSLSAAGDRFVAQFTEDYYRAFMRDWETRLNFYLTSGEILRGVGMDVAGPAPVAHQ